MWSGQEYPARTLKNLFSDVNRQKPVLGLDKDIKVRTNDHDQEKKV